MMREKDSRLYLAFLLCMALLLVVGLALFAHGAAAPKQLDDVFTRCMEARGLLHG